MELISIVSQMVFNIILVVLAWVAVARIIKYLNQKSIIDYKTYNIGTGIKHYVDETLGEYITDAMEEIITTDPKFIGSPALNSDLEIELIKRTSHQVLSFMSESFKDQMRMVYDIDRPIKIDNKFESGLTNIVTRRVYLEVLKISVATNNANSGLKDIANYINKSE